MDPKLIEKVLIGNKTIKLSRRFEEANNFGSPPNSHTNLSLARNHLHNKSYSVLERGENENSLKRRGNNGMNKKLCSRGHWRPTEDAKLKELVTQFGPQNWNLIAHHLLGRSGTFIYFYLSAYHYFHFLSKNSVNVSIYIFFRIG